MTRARLRGGPARAVVVALFLVGGPVQARAQEPDTTVVVDSVVVTPEADPAVMQAGDTASLPITPGGAFLRSLVIPGWGQSAFGSYGRGGLYYAGWVGNWFMVFRNQVRLNDARQLYARRVAQLEAQIITSSENPDSMRTALAEDPSILEAAVLADDAEGYTANNLRKVVSSREQQREDWLALHIFWILAAGVDAYVTAHLADLPTGIDIRPNPDRSLSLEVHVPLPLDRP